MNIEDFDLESPHHTRRDEGCMGIEENFWGAWGTRRSDGKCVFGRGDTPEEATENLRQNILSTLEPVAPVQNYRIITDEQKLRDFIDWLPELEDDETYYVTLFSRKKYCGSMPHTPGDKTQLKRFTSSKELLYWKIRQLECPLGSYYIKGVETPQEALVLYITVNPRNQRVATRESIKKLADLLTRNYDGWNVHQEILSEVQKAHSPRKPFVDFDLDTDDKKLTLANIKIYLPRIINHEAATLMESRGGFHLLIRPSLVDPQYEKTWYKDIVNTFDPDVRGDNLIPVPGTIQGGFTPHFVKL